MACHLHPGLSSLLDPRVEVTPDLHPGLHAAACQQTFGTVERVAEIQGFKD